MGRGNYLVKCNKKCQTFDLLLLVMADLCLADGGDFVDLVVDVWVSTVRDGRTLFTATPHIAFESERARLRLLK